MGDHHRVKPAATFTLANVRRIQQWAASLMCDQCTVSAVTRVDVDPATGMETPVVRVIWSGKCRVQSDGGVGGDNTDTGGKLNEWLQRIDFPVAASGLDADQVVTITSSVNPDLIGRTYRMVSPHSRKTYASAQRWNVRQSS